MKHKPLIPLITLLKILNNRFEPEEQRRLEIKVRKDSVSLARLQQLRNAVGSTTTLNLNEKSIASTDQEYELQRIAAFLDGTLSDEESLSFENECWASESLLHDVIVLFRSGLQSHTSIAADSNASVRLTQQRQLRERLVGLFPTEPTVAVGLHDVETEATRTTGSPALDDESNLDWTPVVATEHLSKKTKPTLSNVAKAAIAIATVLAIVALSIAIGNWNAMTTQPKIVVETPKATEDADKQTLSPKIVESEHRDDDKGRPDPLDREQIADLPNANDQPQNTDKTLPDFVEPKTQVVKSPEGSPSNDALNPPIRRSPKKVDDVAVQPTTRQRKLQWNWGRIEGLIATRTDKSDLWSGASSVDVSNSQPDDLPDTERINAGSILEMECKVLQLSWGQAKVKGMGSWTVAENTDFSVGPIPAQQTKNELDPDSQAGYRSEDVIGAKINLRRGGLAISGANVDSAFLIETATGNWRIRIKDPATVVVIEQFSSSRLVVQNGSIGVNGKELKTRQQLVQSAAGQLEQTTNRQSIKWLKKPANTFPSKKLSAQWQASRDLFTDLSPDTISPENQPLVRFALATIDPQGQAKSYLANVLPEVRAEGIQWLLAYGSDPRQLRKLAGELATEMNTPGLGRTLPKLVLAIKTKRWPAKADAESLVKGLQNRNVSVRRFSHGLLVHLFGTLEEYNPESKPAAQSVQARKWSSAINRLYRRVENARQ